MIRFGREELTATGVGLSLAAALGVGCYGSPAQATVPAVTCLVVVVALARESARIDSRLEAMPSSGAFVTLNPEEQAEAEKLIRACGRETTRWLQVWASLYAAVGSIAPMVFSLTSDERVLSREWPAACALVITAAAAALISNQRQVLHKADAHVAGLQLLHRTAEQLTDPTTPHS